MSSRMCFSAGSRLCQPQRQLYLEENRQLARLLSVPCQGLLVGAHAEVFYETKRSTSSCDEQRLGSQMARLPP